MTEKKHAKTMVESINMFIEKFPKDDCVYLLCGSALTKENYRDVDYIVYVCNGIDIETKNICSFLDSYNICYTVKTIENLSMVSLKFSLNDVIVSIHLVELSLLNSALDKISDEKSYTEIDVFSFNLNNPTIYRKWIIETLYVSGDKKIYEEVKSRVRQELIPYDSIKSVLYQSIMSKMLYYEELEKLSSVSKVILYVQMLNELLLYCYAENKILWGTIKYVESDMNNFTVNKQLCNICENAFRKLGGSSENISSEIEKIKNSI